MTNSKGSNHIALAILVGVVAIGIVGATWWYFSGEKETIYINHLNPNAVTNKNTNKNLNQNINAETTNQEFSEVTFSNEIRNAFEECFNDNNEGSFENFNCDRFCFTLKFYKDLNNDSDYAIYVNDKESKTKEIFMSSIYKTAGTRLMNLRKAKNQTDFLSGEIYQIADKLFFRPYDEGSSRPLLSIWELNLNNKKFRELNIGRYLYDYPYEFSPDNQKILVPDFASHKILKILNIYNDSERIVATSPTGQVITIGKPFTCEMGQVGEIGWESNTRIFYALYKEPEEGKKGCITRENAQKLEVVHVDLQF